MSPKEKAEEFIEKFVRYTPAEEEFEYPYAKQCALIAVDEIFKTGLLEGSTLGINKKYWQEVKQEIETYGGDK
jgi:hypothetical protein